MQLVRFEQGLLDLGIGMVRWWVRIRWLVPPGGIAR